MFTYIEAENHAAAVIIDERIVAAAGRLLDFPAVGVCAELLRHANFISGTPYVAAYAITETTVRILRVFHGAQECARLFGAKLVDSVVRSRRFNCCQKRWV